MGIRVHYKYDGVNIVVKIDQYFYWEHIEEMDDSCINNDISIWLKYIESTDYNSDSIRLMLTHWDNITDFNIY